MKIRTRIFAVFVLVVGAGFYFLVQWIGDDLRPRYLESVEEPLVDVAHLLAELIADDFGADGFDSTHLEDVFERVYQRRFKAEIYALEKHDVDMRVYITDRFGKLIFDSSGRDVGADYSQWNDVLRTLRGEYGARASNEDPVNPTTVVLYIAAPVIVGGEIVGVVSVGKPARNADRFLQMAKDKLFMAGLIAAAIVLLLGLGLYLWVSRPLQKLVRYARAVKEGRRIELPRLGANEIGMMGAAMEEMRQELAGREYAERYVQSLTHEFKSPLAAIRGAAELLDEQMPAAARRKFLTNIRTETQRLQDLVERMLELAALEKRQTLQRVEAIDLEALVNDVVSSLEPLALKQKVMFKRHIESPVRMRGERFLLNQAITNLVRNALAFSPGGASIDIKLRQTAAAAVLSISDHGPGIPEYAMTRVFERFFSLGHPEGHSKSTGLGLSFVKEIAELHGGQIELSNRPEGGAEAILTLPLIAKLSRL